MRAPRGRSAGCRPCRTACRSPPPAPASTPGDGRRRPARCRRARGCRTRAGRRRRRRARVAPRLGAARRRAARSPIPRASHAGYGVARAWRFVRGSSVASRGSVHSTTRRGRPRGSIRHRREKGRGLAVTRLWGVPAPMRDGVALNTDIYLPDAGVDGGPYPGVLLRTPYSCQGEVIVTIASYLARHGYAVALQDVRGRYGSDGAWEPFRREGPDGHDAVEWIADQPWCSGRVGTMGTSYEGWAQWALARERPPRLVTMVSTAAAGRWMEELPFDRGVPLLVVLPWLHAVSGRVVRAPWLVPDLPDVLSTRPLATMDERLGNPLPLWREWLEHPTLDDYWQALRLGAGDFRRIDLPVLHVTGWYDDDQRGALFFHAGMCEHSPRAADQHLVVGPWEHAGTRAPARQLGGVDFGPAALEDIGELHRRWFDHWLKGDVDGAWSEPRARVFLGGANAWRGVDAWPPRDAQERALYLRSDGRANT